jgi:hypothetical protein
MSAGPSTWGAQRSGSNFYNVRSGSNRLSSQRESKCGASWWFDVLSGGTRPSPSQVSSIICVFFWSKAGRSNGEPPKLQFADATHELMVGALNPVKDPRHDDPMTWQCLTAQNVVIQFQVDTDASQQPHALRWGAQMCCRICCKTVDACGVTKSIEAHEFSDFVLAWRALEQPSACWDTLLVARAAG